MSTHTRAHPPACREADHAVERSNWYTRRRGRHAGEDVQIIPREGGAVVGVLQTPAPMRGAAASVLGVLYRLDSSPRPDPRPRRTAGRGRRWREHYFRPCRIMTLKSGVPGSPYMLVKNSLGRTVPRADPTIDPVARLAPSVFVLRPPSADGVRVGRRQQSLPPS